MEWTQLKVSGLHADLDKICAVMCMLDNGLMIEDYSDIDMNTVYADLIDEEILKIDKNLISVSIFVPPERSAAEYAAFLRDRFCALQLTATVELIGVAEEEWATAWKQYYKPLRIADRLVVVPEWELYTPKENDLVITMDPGMAFGTGTHETTQLCCQLLEKYVQPQSRMLDVGTGSGILSIAAAKLGAHSVDCCDIDPVAVRVANENITRNHVQDRVHVFSSDLLSDVPIQEERYTLACANIVADVILRMAKDLGTYLASNAVFLASGIIDIRAAEVESGLRAHGFTVLEKNTLNGWCAYAFLYQQNS